MHDTAVDKEKKFSSLEKLDFQLYSPNQQKRECITSKDIRNKNVKICAELEYNPDKNVLHPSTSSDCLCEYSNVNRGERNFYKPERVSGQNMYSATSFDRISFGHRRQQFKPHRNRTGIPFTKRSSFAKTETLNDKKKQEASEFRYGNYHQYYGYRNQGCVDSRLSCMKKEWFHSKNVLDIGCNAGHLTLSIARDFSPTAVVGIDIDEELIKIAKRNVKHYIDYNILSVDDFPLSLAVNYGPVAQSLDPKYRFSTGNFPFNVQFIQGNYILSSDEALEWQEQFFDTILCFSLTKWVHLNWGDEGVKRLFHRAFAHLQPNGCFLLEAQSFQSYSKRKKITEETFKHFNKIQFYPDMFNEYLLTEVGFKSCELVDTPPHSSKGFSRPIYLFIKGDEPIGQTKPKHVFYNSDSEQSCNYSDIEQLSD